MCKGVIMQKIFLLLSFFMTVHVFARDCNLVVIVDNLHQETVNTEEMNMTHQLVTALQQRSSAVVASTSLWKNIIKRKESFAQHLEDQDTCAVAMLDLYQTTNKELQQAKYNLATVNKKLGHTWFFQYYPQLASLPQDIFNQLRFDFLCYMFNFSLDEWRVYYAHTGMLLFIPKGFDYHINPHYEIEYKADMIKHAEKKSNVAQTLEKLLVGDDRWVMYLTGHGYPKSTKQGANIAGLKVEDFKKLLQYCNDHMHIRLFVYSSCFGGGVHTIEPYENIQLHFPVIVTALTDAPIFGFGLFEGVKLPPYDDQFALDIPDVKKNEGLQPCALQNYGAFFKRAWKGLFDLHLIQYISKFFACDFLACHVQKIENFPLIRKARSTVFTPIKDGIMFKLVQQVTSNTVISSNKPMLLYTKKVKKIKIDKALPIISMLPGITSHEIGELIAPNVALSLLLSQSFLSIEDQQSYKNFLINKLTCHNDLLHPEVSEALYNVLIADQKNFMPKFIDKEIQSIVYFQSSAHEHHLFTWQDHKIVQHMILNLEQIDMMLQILDFVQKSAQFKSNEPFSLLTFDAYQENKKYQQELAHSCVKIKVCRK